MKKHFVPEWVYDNRVYADAVCGQRVSAIRLLKGSKATYRKNHVTCRNCRRTKMFRGVR